MSILKKLTGQEDFKSEERRDAKFKKKLKAKKRFKKAKHKKAKKK